VIPGDLTGYLDDVVTRLGEELGDLLVGVYAGGSLALGGYIPGRSDVDLAAVTASPPSVTAKRKLVARLRHDELPCPARGLELVVYPEATVRVPTVEPGFELNLNTGSALPFRVDLDPGVANAHWFAIDRSILSAHGIALFGPPTGEVFAPIPSNMLLPILADSVRWHEQGSHCLFDTVLNGCRSLRYAEDGIWSSKQEAARWALGRLDDPDVVAAALTCEPDFDRAGLSSFSRLVLERIEAASTSPGTF
jgi:Aminoglycoside adenylyltransferase, C-terminal domain/Nucleotidyltransferase domain